MTAQVIVAATDSRSAIGHRILGAFTAAAALCGVVAATQLERGTTAPIREISRPQPEEAARPQVAYGSVDRQVIAVGQGTRRNRCDVRGLANGEPLIFEVDTGDPRIAEFPRSYVRKLKIAGKLNYSEWWPGTRYGKIATTTLRDIRIGDVVWNNPEVTIYSDWDYTFGSDEVPLLGLAALKMHGINVEFEGNDRCRLTVARNRQTGS